MPIGMEIPEICHESMVFPIFGIYFDINKPIIMQIAIQSGKNFSNLLNPSCFFAM
ncbi:MAG: hypothetical protein ACTSRZ_16355 [Promethearchaeota archaeon]